MTGSSMPNDDFAGKLGSAGNEEFTGSIPLSGPWRLYQESEVNPGQKVTEYRKGSGAVIEQTKMIRSGRIELNEGEYFLSKKKSCD